MSFLVPTSTGRAKICPRQFHDKNAQVAVEIDDLRGRNPWLGHHTSWTPTTSGAQRWSSTWEACQENPSHETLHDGPLWACPCQSSRIVGTVLGGTKFPTLQRVRRGGRGGELLIPTGSYTYRRLILCRFTSNIIHFCRTSSPTSHRTSSLPGSLTSSS